MKIMIADKFETEGIEGLKALGCEVMVQVGLKDDALRDAVAATRPAILVVRSTQVSAAVINACPELKVIIRAGSGYNTIDVAAASQRGVWVTNCPGKNAVAVAELAMGLMLAVDRRIPDNVIALRQGKWDKKGFGKARGLKGRTLGIVGLGVIGKEIAVRARAFEMNVIYSDVVRAPEFESKYGLAYRSMDDVLREADFITLHLPLLPDTKRLIDAKKLALMKPTTVLINTSRGEVIDQPALIEALRSGKLAWAALDVYEDEPGANDTTYAGPIAQVPNFYGTHHIGASTDQAQLAVAAEVVRIVDHYQRTGEVLNCVNRK